MALGDGLQTYTFAYLINLALSYVPDTVDKRKGSIIYDTLAPFCYELALSFNELYQITINTYALTATGEWLDYRVAEQGITRYPANAAVKRGIFETVAGNPKTIVIGTRFSTITDDAANLVNYTVTAPYRNPDSGIVVPGQYELTCEVAGTVGNAYIGNLLPINYVSDLGRAYMDLLLVPGSDAESDDDLRARYLDLVNQRPFGGNISQYRQEVLEIEGVGAVQVYPVWNGGGTVKLSIIGSDYGPASGTLINNVQTEIDPEVNQGIGLGLAPIGHQVTVVTPDELQINVEATLTLGPDVTLGQVQEPIEDALGAYLLSLRHDFGVSTDLNVYSISVFRARVISTILTVEGVENVTNLLLNGEDADITLREDATVQQLPMLGTVTLNEV